MKKRVKKTFVLTTLLLFALTPITAQKYGKVGVAFSPSISNVLLESSSKLRTTDKISGSGFVMLGVDYWYPLSDQLSIETGLDYSFQRFSKELVAPAAGQEKYQSLSYHLLSIPVGVKFNFMKYAYLNAGLLIDATGTTGIGNYFGLGAEFESEFGLGLFINPYVRSHATLPFDFNADAQRIMDVGLKIGFTYSLDYLTENYTWWFSQE